MASADKTYIYTGWKPSLIHEFPNPEKMAALGLPLDCLELWLPLSEGSGPPRDHSGKNHHPDNAYDYEWVSSPYGHALKFKGTGSLSNQGLVWSSAPWASINYHSSGGTVIWFMRRRVGPEGNAAFLRSRHIWFRDQANNNGYQMGSQLDGNDAHSIGDGTFRNYWSTDTSDVVGQWIEHLWIMSNENYETIYYAEDNENEFLGRGSYLKPNAGTFNKLIIGGDNGGTFYGEHELAEVALFNVPQKITHFKEAATGSGYAAELVARLRHGIG